MWCDSHLFILVQRSPFTTNIINLVSNSCYPLCTTKETTHFTECGWQFQWFMYNTHTDSDWCYVSSSLVNTVTIPLYPVHLHDVCNCFYIRQYHSSWQINIYRRNTQHVLHTFHTESPGVNRYYDLNAACNETYNCFKIQIPSRSHDKKWPY